MLSGMSEDERAGALKILRSMIRSLREESWPGSDQRRATTRGTPVTGCGNTSTAWP